MRAAALAALLLLAGCGFQLRNDLNLPPVMQTTYISYTGTSAGLMNTVARSLALADVRVVANPFEDAAILQILSASSSRRVLSKDFSGRARESEIVMVLRYRLLNAQGGVLIPVQEVTRRTQVVLDPNDPLSSSGEISNATETLREDAVWDMLRRIAATEIPAQPVDTVDGIDTDEPADDDWRLEDSQ